MPHSPAVFPHPEAPRALHRAPRPVVLLVEDDRDTRQMYAACLDVSRLDIVQAHDGLQALDQARALQPDLIVTDLAIPGIDGFELCRRLQADVRTREIPLIAITGQYVTPPDIERARRLGCGQVLLKPCLPDRLMAVVQETLRRRPRRQPPAI